MLCRSPRRLLFGRDRIRRTPGLLPRRCRFVTDGHRSRVARHAISIWAGIRCRTLAVRTARDWTFCAPHTGRRDALRQERIGPAQEAGGAGLAYQARPGGCPWAWGWGRSGVKAPPGVRVPIT